MIKILHQSIYLSISLSLSLSLFQVPPQVCHDTNRTAELNFTFRFGEILVVRQISCVWL